MSHKSLVRILRINALVNYTHKRFVVRHVIDKVCELKLGTDYNIVNDKMIRIYDGVVIADLSTGGIDKTIKKFMIDVSEKAIKEAYEEHYLKISQERY